MEKIKKFLRIENITKIVLCYVLLQPILDILSFLNIRGYIPGISTIVKPLFVFGIGIYIYFTDKKSRKKYTRAYILFAILMVIHSLVLKDLMIENSVILHEIRFMINFAYMLVLFMVFEFLYRNNEDKDKFIKNLKKTVVVTFLIYCSTVIIAVLTGTSAKTYEYADASKSGFKGWLDSGQIFGHAMCIVFPFLIHYLFHLEDNNKVLKILSKIAIILPVIILAIIGTKVTYLLDIAILGSHVVIDFIVAIRDKKKMYFVESAFCLICLIAVIGAYPYTPVKKNTDINNAVLAVDMSQNQEGSETNREDLDKMKNNMDSNSNDTSWWQAKRVKRLSRYYECDVRASEKLEKAYASGSLHPSDMRNRQLIYNSEKYKHADIQYKLFGIGYLNQSNFLSLERDSLMLLFSFGIIGLITILLKPILIWLKALLNILRNLKKVSPETLYLFEGFSLFFCISVYAGYTFIYTNFSIYLVIIGILLMNSIKQNSDNPFAKYFDKIFNKGRKSFYEDLEKNIKDDKKEFIITANPETIMTSEKNEGLRNAYLDNDTVVIPDGVGIIKGAKIMGYDISETVLGVDVACKLLELADKYEKKVFLFGAKKEVLEKMQEVLKEKYPKAELVGTVDGYVDDRQKVFNDIKELKPDVVLVALGIPAQEKLIYDNLNDFDKGIFVGVGGSFDVISGMKKRAPKIFIKLKLEWLYRITTEPKRLKRFYRSNIKYLFQVKQYEEM